MTRKVAIVTGASRGIGRATSLALARRNLSVVLASRSASVLDEIAAEIRKQGGDALAVPTDVTDSEQVRNLGRTVRSAYGEVDVLVCNAGIYPRGSVRDLKLDQYRHCMEVNYFGALNVILEFLPEMLERRSGHVVVVSSVDGKKGLPKDAAYVASKFALTGFLDVMRQELRGSGVSVSTILPGRVDTPMIENLRVPWISAKISSERVAGSILRVLRSKQGEIIVPYPGPKLLIVASSISAPLGDMLVRLFKLEGVEKHDHETF